MTAGSVSSRTSVHGGAPASPCIRARPSPRFSCLAGLTDPLRKPVRLRLLARLLELSERLLHIGQRGVVPVRQRLAPRLPERRNRRPEVANEAIEQRPALGRRLQLG